jgi:hypothetical protein
MMDEAWQAHLEPLLTQIHQLGDHAREQLDWGRKNLSKEVFGHFQEKTVEALNKEVEHLLGFEYESDV